MKSIMTVDGVNYNLYSTSSEVTKEEMVEAREYNSGMDVLWGCDFLTVYAYLVKKENTEKFISKITDFIEKIESLELDDEDVDPYESMNHFAYAHKIVEDSEYDFFFTNFDVDLLQEEVLTDEYEQLVKELEEISDFFVYAGANASGDDELKKFALSYLYQKYPPIVEKYLDKKRIELLYHGDLSFGSFPFKEDSDDKILDFIKVYFYK